MKFKIQGTKYTRDTNSMALMCDDLSEKIKYESELAKYNDNIRRDEEINNIKSELFEIKQMLQVLIRGHNG